jgi:preprotein translocase subunit SecA
VELVRQDQQQRAPQRVQENKAEVESGSTGGSQEPVNSGASQQAVSDKVPRNAPCPCGSGKKYKKCHGLEV